MLGFQTLCNDVLDIIHGEKIIKSTGQNRFSTAWSHSDIHALTDCKIIIREAHMHK